MGWWREQVVPRLVDVTLGSESTTERRQVVGRGAVGTVVELGFGSGRNLRHYPETVDQVLAVEPSALAWTRAQEAIADFGRPVRLVGADAAALALDAASVDTVVSTWTMCTIPDLAGALAQVRRVLRPGGRLRFVEHGLSPDPAVRRTQRRLQPLWGPVAGGCHLDRDILTALTAAGFRVDDPDSSYTGWPRSFAWCTIGSASP